MMTVKQVANLTGVSVRTLHWYDKIGLFKPRIVSDNGYRIYENFDLERLQQILFFRELGFELKEIGNIMNSSDFDNNEALLKHKELLTLKIKRINKLIKLVDQTLKGKIKMSFKEFDMTEIENAQKEYKQEVEERWGDTEAYKESQRKTSKYTKDDWAKISSESGDIYNNFVKNMNKSPSSPEVQQLVADWQGHITKYYYKCSKEILSGLGQMYIQDERFTKNIDKFGVGLAEFMSKAIEEYCK